MSPSKIPRNITEKLVFANVLVDEMKESWEVNNSSGKKNIVNVIAGDKRRKYRMKKKLSKKTGIQRKNFKKVESKKSDKIEKRRRNESSRSTLRQHVKLFLESDDNSREKR